MPATSEETRDYSPCPLARRIIMRPWFDIAILMLILTEQILGTVTLLSPTCCRTRGTDIAAVVVSSFFACEAIIKIAALGLFTKPHGYLRSGWNTFDLITVVAAWILHSQRLGDGLYVSFRLLRVLRPLRANHGTKRIGLIVSAIMNAIDVLRDFFLVLLLFIFPFAIFGTRFIGQSVRLSNTTTVEGTTNLALWGDFPSSVLTLFQIATLDWGDIARGSILTEPWLALFFIPFIITVGFGVTNIFITVMGETYTNVVNEDEASEAVKTRELAESLLSGERPPEAAYEDVGQRMTNQDIAYMLAVLARRLPKNDLLVTA